MQAMTYQKRISPRTRWMAGVTVVVLPLLLSGATAVRSQPTNITGTPALTLKNNLLTTEGKAATERMIVMAERLAIADTPISLSVKDATVQDVVGQVQKALPLPVPIEVRQVGEVRLTFTIKEKPLGEVLEALATLAGVKFDLLADRIVLAPKGSLTTDELKERLHWSPRAGFFGRDKVITKVISLLVQEMDQQQIAAVNYGSISPDQQRLLQYVADRMRMDANLMPVRLTPDARITRPNDTNEFNRTTGTARTGTNYKLVIDLPSQRVQLRWTIRKSQQ